MVDDKHRQRFSMLVDGELPLKDAADVAVAAERNKQTAVLDRYYLIGEAIRAKQGFPVRGDFVARVSADLAREPVLLVPATRKRRHRQAWVTSALAASLVLVAVLVARSLTQPETQQAMELARVAHSEAGLAGDASTDSTVDINLNNYLITHNETAYLAANGGLLPYVRAVSYANRAP